MTMQIPDYVTAEDWPGVLLAQVLAKVLAVSLPQPRYITMSPSGTYRNVGLQFGPDAGDPLEVIGAWADWYGSEVTVQPGEIRAQTSFRYEGVTFDVYAYVPDGQS
jgi:hypothetical protein